MIDGCDYGNDDNGDDGGYDQGPRNDVKARGADFRERALLN
jgi:hypothetical protein